MLNLGRRVTTTAPQPPRSCRQCGRVPANPAVTVCGRCGIPFGGAPRADVQLPTCPICYRAADDRGLLPPLGQLGPWLPLADHVAGHDRHPVGDDEWLEMQREGDRIRVGRWYAPFDLVRRYLVTGAVDGGRTRQLRHDAVVTAMAQLARWGSGAPSLVGDQPEWREARAAVADLMERYHRG